MAYSFQPIDQALESLGKSYIDGVTVKISSKYAVDYDLDGVKHILDSTNPSVLSFESNYDTSFEKKVLDDFVKRKTDEEIRSKERKERIEAYEKLKSEEIARVQREEEEKALEDERKRLLEIEEEKKAKKAEEETVRLEQLKLEEERAKQRKMEEDAEWEKFEQERSILERVPSLNKESSNDPDDKKEEDSGNESFNTPPQEPTSDLSREPTSQLSRTQIQVKGTQSAQIADNLQINYSDFEALSDPFADLELKTINDLAELQTILTSNHVAPASNIPSNFHSSSSTTNPQQTVSNIATQPYQSNLHTASQGYIPGQFVQPGPLYYGAPGQVPKAINHYHQYPSNINHTQSTQPSFANFPAFSPTTAYNTSTPTSSSVAFNQTVSNSTNPFYSSYSNAAPPFNNNPSQTIFPGQNPNHLYNFPKEQNSLNSQESKGTRSVSSDRRTEKLKDGPDEAKPGELKPSRSVGDMITELQKEAQALQDQKRKSPNPNSRPASRGATGLENWTPWPTLEQEKANKANIKQKSSEEVDDSCLKNLMDDEAKICRQLHEMGFPLSRLAKGCQAVGGNSQKLINFCLVVDRLVDEGYSTNVAEEVAMLHNAEEEICRKHLKSFQQLAEIGFPNKDVHQALIATSFDHQKALDQLIR